MAHRNKNIKLNEGTGTSGKVIGRNNRVFAVAVIVNMVIVLALYISGFWQISLAWILGVVAIFPFFAAFRQVLEHRSPKAAAGVDYNKVDHGVVHRMFGEGIIASTMGPAGFNRHLLHHWDPQVSYTCFKEVEVYLKDTPLAPDMELRQTTYVKTFMALLNR